jgi:hypothetical protein
LNHKERVHKGIDIQNMGQEVSSVVVEEADPHQAAMVTIEV